VVYLYYEESIKMPVVQTATNTNSFESVWAAFQETDRLIKEVRESQKETDRQMKENERIFKESSALINKKIGSLTNLFGDFTLGMVAPKLREKFMDIGLVFPKASLSYVVADRINEIFFEVDIMLENGDKAILVEVKTKLTKERINKHIERLEKMRRYANIHGDKRTFLGAVAGFAIEEEERKMTSEEGFYLIEPDGENFNITPPNNTPKEW
jgi:hypothetical protein